jgi:DNA mismatch repair protein MutS2
MSAAWDAPAAAALGLDWLAAELAPASEFGRARRATERAFAPGDEDAAERAIGAVAGLAQAAVPETLGALYAALAGAPDPSSALARAIAGDVLSDVDFFELSRFLDALEVTQAIRREPAFAGVPGPRAEDSLRAALAAGRTSRGSFYLEAAFDPELAAARHEAVARQAAYDAVRSQLLERLAAALGFEHVRDGEFVVMRDRLSGPLPPGARVLREAPTYLLCELALDDDALAALAARDAAATRVAEVEERVRARLTGSVAAAAPALRRACDDLGALDAFVTRARFAQRHTALAPAIARDGRFSFVDARWLPLAETLAASGRAYAPISLDLDGIGVLSGPNMGGKSAALATCGFVAACVALGVPVPARAATVPLFDAIGWIGASAREPAGDAAPEQRLLSSFGGEVIALGAFLERSARNPLALIDEFARTTSPREGRALLVALLETLRERGAHALAATHLHGIAAEAGVAHFAIVGLRELPARDGAPRDLASALERIGRAMDYRITRVDEDAVPRADALALADLLGLDPELLARARATLGAAAD